MRIQITYHEADDILHIVFSTEPTVRDVSQSWYVNLDSSATGLAGITILDARAGGFWPIEEVGAHD